MTRLLAELDRAAAELPSGGVPVVARMLRVGVALVQVRELGVDVEDPHRRAVDVHEVDGSARTHQGGEVVDDRLLLAAVVRQDVPQSGAA